MTTRDTFPRQYARTQRLTLGEPRNITVSADGRRIFFLRSSSGSDSVNSLWMLDQEAGVEKLLVDPRTIGANLDTELPPEERARRERLREGAGGITSYTCDPNFSTVIFTLSGRLHIAQVAGKGSADVREINLPHSVFDARQRPGHDQISYVFDNGLWLTDFDGNTRRLTPDEGELITWGMAEFAAAEEMDRQRGYWWSPDGAAIATCRADNSPLHSAWIGDPAEPQTQPREHRYPFAGTPNSIVEVFVLNPETAAITSTGLKTGPQFEYVASVQWRDVSRLVVGTLSRDQREYRLAQFENGHLTEIWSDVDAAWVELVPGSPVFTADDRLAVAADRDGRRCIINDGRVVTPASLQVRSIVTANDHGIVFSANELNEPTQLHVYLLVGDTITKLSDNEGVNGVAIGGSTRVLRSTSIHSTRSTTRVIGGSELANIAEEPLLLPNVTLHTVGERGLRCALVLPANYEGGALPVLCDPYGGPHAQRVVSSHHSYLTSQWFANQGFAVVITDGRGTSGRGTEWERSIKGDVASIVLQDQVDALQELANSTGALDLTKVGIRGWSFGGYLAALAVLRRPDVFHCGIAGAPVTDWRLYDTCYTGRYLGNPTDDPAPYESTSLITDAAKLENPLLLIHGLADDNVLPAHTLQLSNALLAHGRLHEVLPLSGVSHMTPQEVVAENLLLHELEFLRRSLNL
jgi:dipeptidyl-peptidase-4